MGARGPDHMYAPLGIPSPPGEVRALEERGPSAHWVDGVGDWRARRRAKGWRSAMAWVRSQMQGVGSPRMREDEHHPDPLATGASHGRLRPPPTLKPMHARMHHGAPWRRVILPGRVASLAARRNRTGKRGSPRQDT